MALGFIPKYTEKLSLHDLTQEQALILMLKTVEKMTWNISYTSNAGIIAYTDNGAFSWNGEITIRFENGIATIKSTSTGSDVIDRGRNKNAVTDFLAAFNVLKLNFTKEQLDLEYESIRNTLPAEEEDQLRLPPEVAVGKVTNFLSVFIPVKGFFVTPVLLDLNILIFILMALSGVNIFTPDNESLLNWGASFKPSILGGEWWRLISSCFIHIGLFHLLFNMYALLYIGALLEPILGRTKFITAYLLTGITGSIASLWWHDLTIGAGASGAIFGMYGVFLALLTTNFIEKNSRKAMLSSIGLFVGYNLVFGLKSGIDNAAHIGGLIGGLAIGYAFVPGLKKPANGTLNSLSIGIVTVLVIAFSVFSYYKIPNDIGTYDAKIKEFVILEAKAIDIFNTSENTPPYDTILKAIQQTGIPSWKENIKLLESMETLNLPDNVVIKNRLLIEYCKLRIENYELRYKAYADNTNAYQSQINSSDSLVSEKMSEIEKVE